MILLRFPGRLIPTFLASVCVYFPYGYLIYLQVDQAGIGSLNLGIFTILQGLVSSTLAFVLVLGIHFLSIKYVQFVVGGEINNRLAKLLKRNDKRLPLLTKLMIFAKILKDFNFRVTLKEDLDFLSGVVDAIVSNSHGREILWYAFELTFVQCFVSGCLIAIPGTFMLIGYAFMQGDDVLFFSSIGMFMFYLIPFVYSRRLLISSEVRFGKKVFTIYAFAKTKEDA